MFTKFYLGLWATFGAAGLLLYLTGNLTWLSATVMEFFSCVLIFMGMMCILPVLVGPHAPDTGNEAAEPAPAREKKESRWTVAPGGMAKASLR